MAKAKSSVTIGRKPKQGEQHFGSEPPTLAQLRQLRHEAISSGKLHSYLRQLRDADSPETGRWIVSEAVSALLTGAEHLMDRALLTGAEHLTDLSPTSTKEEFTSKALEGTRALLESLDVNKDEFEADTYKTTREALWMFHRVLTWWQSWHFESDCKYNFWTLPSTVSAMTDATRLLRHATYLLGDGELSKPPAPPSERMDLWELAAVMQCGKDFIRKHLPSEAIVKSLTRTNAGAASTDDVLKSLPPTKFGKQCRENLLAYLAKRRQTDDKSPILR